MKKIGRNDSCWCGSGKKYKNCHEAMDEKLKIYMEKGCIVPTHDIIRHLSRLQESVKAAK